MSSEPKQNSTSGFNSLPLCLGTGGRRENNVIKYSSVEFQILHLLMDVSHHWWGTKGRINSNQTLTQLHYIPVACFRAAGHTKITRPHVSPLTHRNKLKHTGSTKERQWLYSTLAYLGTGYYCFWLRQGSHAAWKQMGATAAMTDSIGWSMKHRVRSGRKCTNRSLSTMILAQHDPVIHLPAHPD